ncbi:hypothetical protein GCM10027435_25310 [Haloparvum alkalitolerans]|uniref:hypothetical protein n=1 Tax=Haloparvum alkalitolerans TaxID=1042953 RepID=UPI003CE67C6A
MKNLSRDAEKRLSREVSAAVASFDSVLLSNVIHDRFTADDQLVHLAEASARLQYAVDTRRRELADDETAEQLDEQRSVLSHAIEQRARERLAELCELVVADAPTWDNHWDTMQIETAVAEARTWLRTNTNAAERADVQYGAALETKNLSTGKHAAGRGHGGSKENRQ